MYYHELWNYFSIYWVSMLFWSLIFSGYDSYRRKNFSMMGAFFITYFLLLFFILSSILGFLLITFESIKNLIG